MMRITGIVVLLIMVVLPFAANSSGPASGTRANNEAEGAQNSHALARAMLETSSRRPWLSANVPQVQASTQRSQIKAFDLLTEDFGWILTQSAVLTTNDSGKSWKDITPALEARSSLDAAFFFDRTRAWILISGRDSQGIASLTIAYTQDGGRTWQQKPLQVRDESLESYSATAYLDFVDPLHGWILLRQSSSANFSRGSLLVTSDGGSSWEQLPDPPIASPINFVSDTEGWLAGGPNGDELYWTRDSGRHWTPRSVTPPSGNVTNLHTAYELPAFENSRSGVLGVTFTTSKGTNKIFYRTQNGGETWEPGTMSLSVSPDERIAASVVNARTVIVVPSNSQEIEILQEGRRTQRRKIATPQNTFTQIDFVSPAKGWLLQTEGTCAGFKTDCKQVTRLLVTSDGGTTLREITPRVVAPQNTPHPEDAPLAALSDSTEPSASTVTVQNREGFDRCAVATVSQMQNWWTTSPYKAAGVYIGGENHSCKTQSISSSWISNVLNMGWGIIPTWVGPQAPGVFGRCQTSCSKISTNLSTAESQGVAEANKAADQATAYGLSNSIIYYDMEAYDLNTSGAVVRSFMNGWSRRLRERGFKAGGYSSRLTVSDWANIANPPDAIWFTWFFQDGVSCGDDCHTVFGVPGISNSLWFNHQRIRQTSSGFNQCWGTTCLNIDEDWLDGPVAGNGGTNGCSITVGQGTSGAESTAFQNAYNAGGGQPVLGCATAAVRFDGFTSFAGTIGHFQTLANGEIEYLVNGSRAGQAFALTNPFADKWESLGFTNNNPLGYPIGHRTAGTSPSCANTTHEFQSFEGGSLTRHLSGSRSGSVFEVHGAIHAKWSNKGFASCPLGLPISDERNATPSGASGKTGRVSDFERGHIHWWTNAPEAFETHGAIDSLYTSMGGTGSFLGFPISDEYIASTGRPRSDFEGGFITTNDGVNYTAFSNTARTLTVTSVNPNSGVSISVSPNDRNNAGNGTTQFTRSYNNNTTVTLTAPSSAAGNTFQKWQLGGSDWSTNRTTTVVMSANRTMTAVYVANPPPAPSANPATNVNPSSFTANWSSAAGATGYRLDVSTSSTFSSFVSGFQNLDVGNVLSRSVTGLSPGTAYFYRVRAYNNTGTSGNSNSVSATTPAQTFTISVTASPSNGGTVSGGGTFAAGSSRTVTAVANATHVFANWTEGGVVVSTSSSFTFVLNSNRSLVANFTAIPNGNATYDAVLRVPKCGQVGSFCDSGGLLNGRGTISGGPEPNQPNTLFNSCADNTVGTYHNDESADRIRVSTLDGGPFAPGKTIKIEVTVWAFSATNDFLDLFYTADANNPNWTLITTLVPSTTGSQVLSTTFTIPNASGVHAIRANFLFQGAPVPCAGGDNNFDDHDDLAFAVQQPPGPSWQPTVLSPSQVELKNWKVDGRSFIYAKLTFPDAGYRVANWGSATRSGNAFSSNATIEKFSGGSAQVITSNAQIWDLGALAAGNYSFTFKNSGTNVETLNFTVSATAPAPNPIDEARTFVFWQYKDFLRREPDGPGWDHWTNEITMCSNIANRRPGETEAQCVARKRENTSAAFFVSPESQNIAYFVLRVYRGSLDRMPFFGGGTGPADEFTRDAATVGAGIVVNNALDHNRINANKQAFVNQFVTRADFRAIYDGLNNAQYVDKLFQTTGVTPGTTDRQALINGLNGGSETRASVLFKIVDGTTTNSGGLLTFNTTYGKAFYDKLFNAAFVQMEYFGYLQRDPDPGGYAFWLGKLNTFGDWVNAEMVKSFINAPEYRARFGAP